VRGFIDLHSHWVAAVDDGAKNVEEGASLLRALYAAGFEQVIATPHMRPGMFDNDRPTLEAAFARTAQAIGASTEAPTGDLPRVGLASEHFFDDVIFERLVSGAGLPYPGGKAALIEFAVGRFPARAQHRLHDLMQRKIKPVLAHPERYEPVWKDIHILEPLLDVGAVLLLDVAALAGKYGRAPRKAAEALLDAGFYYAACSDAHKAKDVADVRDGIDELFERMGDEEATFLLSEGPRHILEGRVEG
jgi:protein-tyrosine phosphatase